MTQETEQLSPCAIDETVTLSEVLTFLSLLVAWTLKGPLDHETKGGGNGEVGGCCGILWEAGTTPRLAQTL